MCPLDELRRHAYLLSLLEDTNHFIGDSRAAIFHADSSFSLFHPLLPNAWLRDTDQVIWLLQNHQQSRQHGSALVRRLFALPLDVRFSSKRRDCSGQPFALFFICRCMKASVSVFGPPAAIVSASLIFRSLSQGGIKWPGLLGPTMLHSSDQRLVVETRRRFMRWIASLNLPQQT